MVFYGLGFVKRFEVNSQSLGRLESFIALRTADSGFREVRKELHDDFVVVAAD